MKSVVAAAILAAAVLPAAATAQAPAAAPAASAGYTTADTPLGTLMDDPAAKAIVDKYLPGLTSNEQISMARGMTLKQLQGYAADRVPQKALDSIDTDFARMKK